jgi:putative peptidoglycan lipid II flippase
VAAGGSLVVAEDRKGASTIDREANIRGSARTSLLVMICTAGSRLLGFLRIAVIAALFGASGVADVWNAVFTVPNNLRKLLAEGALSAAFIPTLSASLVREPQGTASRRITRNVLTFQALILLPLTLLVILFARPVVTLLLPFPDARKIELSVVLFRWVFGYLFLISVSAVLMAVLNSHNIFIVPALTPYLFSICVIGSTLLLHRQMGVFSMAVGVIAGGLLQILTQLPPYRRLGYSLRPDFDFRNREFRQVIGQWVPLVLSSSIFAVTEQVAVLFASGLEDGSTSALSNALVFWQLPFGIFSVSVITVLFPRMSRQAAQEDTRGLVESLSYGLRFIFILLVPASLLFLILGREIIALALQRGNFTARDTLLTARVLNGYAVGLFSLGAFSFFQRFFYALHDFRSPLAVSLVVSGLDVLCSLWLKGTSLRVTGLAAANSIAFTAGTALMFQAARRRLGRLDGRAMLKTAGRVTLSMVPFVAFLLLFKAVTRPMWTAGGSLGNLILLAVACLTGVLILLAMYLATRVEMVRGLFRRKGVRE